MEIVSNSELVNADFKARVVLDTNRLPWTLSPQPGVERRLLDRVGGEVARATSIVRYVPNASFPSHLHALGEEYLVLDGVFSDEHGDYPAGTYVRNPPGSRHAPFTVPGCTIMVKLRQMLGADGDRVVVETKFQTPQPGTHAGHQIIALYRHADGDEMVTFETLAAGTQLPRVPCAGGEEIFVLSGGIGDELGNYGPGTWIRNPDGHKRGLNCRGGATLWCKRGHLTEARLGASNV